jgi:hypothetical protein
MGWSVLFSLGEFLLEGPLLGRLLPVTIRLPLSDPLLTVANGGCAVT